MNRQSFGYDELHRDETPSATAATAEETDKKCPSCGGTMDYNPAKNNMTCPYCGYEESIPIEEETFVAEELDFNQAENDESCDWGTATRTIICKACGAETVYDFNDIASECPYCGSNQIMEQETQVKVMAPGGVIPFQLDSKAASGRFKSWIKGQFFCPKQAKESAKPKSFTGIYLPFWTFDSNTFSSYTGQYGKVRHRRTRDGKTVSETQWYPTGGHYSLFIDDVLVSGSSRQNEQMLNQIEPFDTTKVVAYKPEYLAGFTAERYAVKVKDAWETAKGKINTILKRDVESKIQKEHGTTLTRFVQLNTTHKNITYKYILLPVWISSFKYNGKIYHFMINGQTGKVSGQAPISWPKVILTVAALIAFFLLIHTMLNADAAVIAQAEELTGMIFSLI